MNSFTFNGTIKSFGEKGNTYKTLWISIQIAPNKSVFVNFPLDSNPGSKKAKLADFIKSKLVKGENISIIDATMTPIKLNKQDAEGNWIQEEKIGLKGNLSNLKINGTQLPVNICCVTGRISKQSENKLVVDDSYRLPTNNEWKIRPIPVLIDESVAYMYTGSLITKDVFVCGVLDVTPDDKLYLRATNIIV